MVEDLDESTIFSNQSSFNQATFVGLQYPCIHILRSPFPLYPFLILSKFCQRTQNYLSLRHVLFARALYAQKNTQLLEGSGGLDWTEYCICDSMLPIAVKGKAGTVSVETEDRTPLGLRLESPLKGAESTASQFLKQGETVEEKYNATLWLVGAENATIRCLARGI